MRVVFLGTPEIAVPTLRALASAPEFKPQLVMTQPDARRSRRGGAEPSPVARASAELGLPCEAVENVSTGEAFARLQAAAPDIVVVVAFGQLLKQRVLDLPRYGCINLHPSSLPKYRGAAPVQRAVMEGVVESGLTVMQLVRKMDAGPILLQVAEPIGADETAAELTQRLSEVGAEILVEALALMEVDAIEEHEQDDSIATFAPRITRDYAHVDWNRDCVLVGCHIRAFDDVPGAWTIHGAEELKLYRPKPAPDVNHSADPGTVLDVERADAAHGLLIACATGGVWVRELQAAGKRRMTTVEWLRGRRLAEGTRFR
jgi:methionyl-tRNA formyltransferase